MAASLIVNGFDMGYWKLQNSAFINQLKEVTIELSHGSNRSNGIEFAGYILDSAQNLKQLTLVHSPQMSSAMTKLKKSRIASNITLDFREDKKRGVQELQLFCRIGFFFYFLALFFNHNWGFGI